MKKNIKLIVFFIFVVGVSSFIFTSCNVLENKTQSGSTLILDSIQSSKNSKEVIDSDVCILVDKSTNKCSLFEDLAKATVRNVPLNPKAKTSYYGDVIIKKYRVSFTRHDGKNTEGVDVPYTFVENLNVSIKIKGTTTFSFVIVPIRAKMEPPLTRLVNIENEKVIQTTANITFYAEDMAGHQMELKGSIDVYFANWADD
jgi:hypothetical protein